MLEDFDIKTLDPYPQNLRLVFMATYTISKGRLPESICDYIGNFIAK